MVPPECAGSGRERVTHTLDMKTREAFRNMGPRALLSQMERHSIFVDFPMKDTGSGVSAIGTTCTCPQVATYICTLVGRVNGWMVRVLFIIALIVGKNIQDEFFLG